jgi:hypothetical protein
MRSLSREVPSELQWIIAWGIPGAFLAALATWNLANGESIGWGYLFVGLVWVPLTFLVLQDAAQAEQIEGRNNNVGARTATQSTGTPPPK